MTDRKVFKVRVDKILKKEATLSLLSSIAEMGPEEIIQLGVENLKSAMSINDARLPFNELMSSAAYWIAESMGLTYRVGEDDGDEIPQSIDKTVN